MCRFKNLLVALAMDERDRAGIPYAALIGKLGGFELTRFLHMPKRVPVRAVKRRSEALGLFGALWSH